MNLRFGTATCLHRHSHPVVISVLNKKLKNALRLISQTAARRDLANVAPLHADWSF